MCPGGFIPDREKMQGGKRRFLAKGMGLVPMLKLQYIDDNIDSYPNIWNNAKTDIKQGLIRYV